MIEQFSEPFQTGSPIFLVLGVYEDHQNENSKGCLFKARKSATIASFDRDTNAGRVEKLYSGKKRRLQVGPDWRLLA